MKEKFLEAIKKLRENSPKRAFTQSTDLIVNLSEIDVRKTPINAFLTIPYNIKVPKICAFLEKKSPLVDRSITRTEMGNLTPKEVKKLGKDYDFFISSAKLMAPVATTFGKTLGPLGKMPNPRYGGVLMVEDEKSIEEAVGKFKQALNIKGKEPSIKVSIGKESMEDDKVAENAVAVYNGVMMLLPKRKDNIRSVLIKFTMSKPEKVAL